MTIRSFLVLSVILICISDPVTSASNILALFAYPGKSHFMVLKAIMIELAKKGNNVTVVSSHSIDDEKLDNYNELLIDPTLDYWTSINNELGYTDMFNMLDMSTKETYEIMNLIGLRTTDYFLAHNHVQNLIKNHKDYNYDLIIVEQFFQDAVLMFGRLYNAPIVAINTYSIENHMSTMMGLILPWAHCPQDFLQYSDKMNFWERLHNVYSSLYSEYNRKYIYFPQQHNLVKKYFGHMSDIPSMEELEKSVSVLLANNYAPIDIPKPMVMGIVYIGGVHIPPPKTVVWDIKRFLDDAHRGVIYFSLGTNLKSSDIPAEKLQAILNVFNKIKQRVLWKWEDENLPNKPDNVMIKKWIPQSDVLAHPAVKYFITHGGLLGIQEALFRNVPILGIPIFGDQHVNTKRAEELGFGLKLDYHNLTEESFGWAINELVSNPQYSMKMREISQIFRDRPVGAMHTAIYWIDYVIRYKGAKHLKTQAIHMPWYQLYLVDIIFFVGFCITLSIIGFGLLTWLGLILSKKYKENQRNKKLSSKDF